MTALDPAQAVTGGNINWNSILQLLGGLGANKVDIDEIAKMVERNDLSGAHLKYLGIVNSLVNSWRDGSSKVPDKLHEKTPEIFNTLQTVTQAIIQKAHETKIEIEGERDKKEIDLRKDTANLFFTNIIGAERERYQTILQTQSIEQTLNSLSRGLVSVLGAIGIMVGKPEWMDRAREVLEQIKPISPESFARPDSHIGQVTRAPDFVMPAHVRSTFDRDAYQGAAQAMGSGESLRMGRSAGETAQSITEFANEVIKNLSRGLDDFRQNQAREDTRIPGTSRRTDIAPTGRANGVDNKPLRTPSTSLDSLRPANPLAPVKRPVVFRGIDGELDSGDFTVPQGTHLERIFAAFISRESGGTHFKGGRVLESRIIDPETGERKPGAIGIAQVMRTTGPEAATLANVSWDPVQFMNDPAYNYKLGFAYFRKQLENYGGDLRMAMAAYNAGPGRVDAKIREVGDPRTGKVTWDRFIASLPEETQGYITNISATLKGIGIPVDKPVQVDTSRTTAFLDPNKINPEANRNFGIHLGAPKGVDTLSPEQKVAMAMVTTDPAEKVDKNGTPAANADRFYVASNAPAPGGGLAG